MIVVSNSSPIMNLAVVGQLQILKQLYGKVCIPETAAKPIVDGMIVQAGFWVGASLYNRVLREVGE